MKKSFYIILAFLIIAGITITFWNPGTNTLTKEEAASEKSLAEYYEQAKQLAPQKEKEVELTTTFLAAGDISLSRNIAQTIKVKNDVLYPFRGMEELLRSTDFNFANLESPFGGHDRFTAKDTLVFNVPAANVQGLADYNFKVLTLANNHALDQGKTGIDFTQKILAENNILHTGIGKTLEEAWQPAIIESNGITIGFIGVSYASINDNGKTTNNYVARIEDTQQLKSQVSRLRQGYVGQAPVDFIVVTMHAGTEYKRNPNQGQIDFAHAAIDAGADIVIGHHPHWIQTIEEYKGKHIFYSLGNFIFDQSWSQDTKEGLALKITLSKIGPICPTSPIGPIDCATSSNLQGSRTSATLQKIELIPIIIKENCCPSPALSVEAQQILKKIGVTNSVIKP